MNVKVLGVADLVIQDNAIGLEIILGVLVVCLISRLREHCIAKFSN